MHCREAASVSNPLAVTKAYAARFTQLGGIVLKGDARTLTRSGEEPRVTTEAGVLDAPEVVVALGPWAQDVLDVGPASRRRSSGSAAITGISSRRAMPV